MSTTSVAGHSPAHPDTATPAIAESRATAIACRALDVVGAVLLLVLLAPLFALLALAIAVDSPGRAIFRQRRMGRGARPFTVNKFRTMRAEASHQTHKDYVQQLIATDAADKDSDEPLFKLSADTRVTRVGRLLRKSSLDELPQLWNVVLGDMSLVGPRPTIEYEVEKYPPSWFARFAVRPGMTGLWQVSGRSRLTYEEMVQLDIEYARNRSLWLNVRILFRTIPAVLFARGAA
jgi:lipopolysaccharide/colanic/teichoic acid biosynthesis glycosyltransferase